MADEQEHSVYVPTKVDVEVMRLVRAAAALKGKSAQAWLSDVANEVASKELARKPLKRKPDKPHPKRPQHDDE